MSMRIFFKKGSSHDNNTNGRKLDNYCFFKTNIIVDTRFSKMCVFFKNVPPSTTIPKCYPDLVFEVPALYRANIGHLTAILANLHKKEHRQTWGQFLINYTVHIYIILNILHSHRKIIKDHDANRNLAAGLWGHQVRV